MRHIERVVKTTKLNVEGIHMHTGSEIKDINVFLLGLDVMLNTVEHFPNLKYIDMGSGFKVPYQPGDNETDVDLLGQKIADAFAQFENPKVKESGNLV